MKKKEIDLFSQLENVDAVNLMFAHFYIEMASERLKKMINKDHLFEGSYKAALSKFLFMTEKRNNVIIKANSSDDQFFQARENLRNLGFVAVDGAVMDIKLTEAMVKKATEENDGVIPDVEKIFLHGKNLFPNMSEDEYIKLYSLIGKSYEKGLEK